MYRFHVPWCRIFKILRMLDALQLWEDTDRLWGSSKFSYKWWFGWVSALEWRQETQIICLFVVMFCNMCWNFWYWINLLNVFHLSLFFTLTYIIHRLKSIILQEFNLIDFFFHQFSYLKWENSFILI